VGGMGGFQPSGSALVWVGRVSTIASTSKKKPLYFIADHGIDQ